MKFSDLLVYTLVSFALLLLAAELLAGLWKFTKLTLLKLKLAWFVIQPGFLKKTGTQSGQNLPQFTGTGTPCDCITLNDLAQPMSAKQKRGHHSRRQKRDRKGRFLR